MWFCPMDGTLLQVMEYTSDSSVFQCATCPYSYNLDATAAKMFSKSIPLQKTKKVDDILGGTAAWENVDRTMAVCPHCMHHEAFFMQMQIRSADEPMSVFYKCVKCGKQWNDR